MIKLMALFLRTIYVLFLNLGDPFKQFGLHQNFVLVQGRSNYPRCNHLANGFNFSF